MLRPRILIACSMALVWLVTNTIAAGSTDSMKDYHFPIDGYELSFSVPKAFLSDYWGKSDEKLPELIIGRPGEGAVASLFSHIHMFAGPIWVGNYAAMDFAVMVVEADPPYVGPISSLEQLEDYKKWQLALPNSYGSYVFSRKTLSGETWLRMILIRMDTSRGGKRDDENTILCFPLGNRRFLQVVCRIKEYVPNKTGRWLVGAHEMREQILDSVVLRKKPNK